MGVTNYFWDEVGDNLLMETDQNGDVIAEYTHEPGQYGKLLSQHRDGHTYFYHYDGEGNTRAVTDEVENVVEEATFSGFGEVVKKTSSIVNPFGYKGALGYYTNGEMDDIYVRARTYEPTVGRWLSLDPARSTVNLYTYSSNNPIVFSDPSGLFTVYGLYCGPGSGPGDPIDCVDQACVEHDSCLATSADWLTLFHRRNCDRELCWRVTACVVRGDFDASQLGGLKIVWEYACSAACFPSFL